MLAMLAHVLRAGPQDPRFAGKGIGPRAFLMVPASCLAMPALWAVAGPRRGPYPFAMDNLFLSITALDLAGNVLDLYNRHRHFDLIPHLHGTGAVTVEIAWLLGLPMHRALAAGTAGHALLEAQEIASDRLFRYRNVRGWWDTTGDLLAGLIGSTLYGALYERLVRGAGREPRSPLAGLASRARPWRGRRLVRFGPAR
jgi:hypothetical protein